MEKKKTEELYDPNLDRNLGRKKDAKWEKKGLGLSACRA